MLSRGKRSLYIFQNVVAPYRVHLFDALATREDLTVFYGSDGKLERSAWQADVGLYRAIIGRGRIYKLGARFAQPSSGVVQDIAQRNPDVVVSVSCRSHALDIYRLWKHCKRNAIPFVTWYAGTSRTKMGKLATLANRVADALIDKTVAGADGAIFYTDYARDCAERLGFKGNGVVGGQLLEPSFPSVTRRPATSEVVELLFVGNFDTRKGLPQLFQALDQSVLKTPIRLSLVGGSEEQLTALIPAWRAKAYPVRCLGVVPRSELGAVYSEADLLVLPSEHDPWGFVAAEAMRCGVPVIASSNAGVSDLVKHAGWVFPSNDLGAFISQITKAIEQCRKLDPKHVQRVEALQSSCDPFLADVQRLIKTLTTDTAASGKIEVSS